MNEARWLAEIGTGLAAGGRWFSLPGIALAGLAAAGLVAGSGGELTRVGLALAVAGGVLQAWLGLRLELDRRLFGALPAEASGVSLAALDRALAAVLPSPPRAAGADLAQRVRGVARLSRRAGLLLALQALLVALAGWGAT